MARKIKKATRKRGKSESALKLGAVRVWHWLMGTKESPASRWARLVRFMGVTAAVIVASVIGLQRLEVYVQNLGEFTSSQVLVSFHEEPDWMLPSLAREILEEAREPIYEELKRAHRDGRDELLPRMFCEQLALSAWVDRVHWVRRVAKGQMIAKCDFREPVAVVAVGKWRYLVDDKGILLPGKYESDAIAGCGLREIRGCAGSATSRGLPWSTPDVTEGLALLRLLGEAPFRHQVKAVDVSNHRGRLDRRRCWILVITDRDTIIRWGRPPGKEGGLETTSGEKLGLLTSIYRGYGHIDNGRASIDIRSSATEVEVSIASSEAIQR